MARKRKKNIGQQHWRFDHKQVENMEKAYYSVGEVAKLFEIEETQLRYWEEHTPLSPKRASGSGARMYSKDDLKLVGKIRYLLQEKGLSLAAVDAQLKGSSIHAELEIREKLFDIRDRVEKLREIVNKQLESDQNG